MQSTKPIRVVQWATGTVGMFAMKAVIEHPQLELVGARVYSEAKVGRDAGELCGLPAVGVTAVSGIEAVLAAEPDCVLYMPESTNVDEVCRLLESGINIVTTRAEFFNPEMMETGLRSRIEAACAQGRASLHATGSSPGFITEVLPIAVASLCRRIDFIGIEEFANCREGCSEEMLTEVMGFGETPEQFAARRCPEHAVFEHSLALLASSLGLSVDSFEYSMEPAYCRHETALHKSTIAAGSVGGQRISITGLHNGKPLVQFRSNWFVTEDLEPAWDLLGNDGWRFRVEGDAPVDMTIRLPMPVEEDVRASGKYTANRPVNVIPAVAAAPPGIVTTDKLPQIVGHLRPA
ncbi:dihydrodipicolinate reductase [Novosphingobium sp. M1R2S20]|uniref:Dihydrodipicolinate reductase n=1 Tax=Novosphingobium rhizovicinum TaxID=3228928 RepID=A0ABV3RFZ6_9SPHN